MASGGTRPEELCCPVRMSSKAITSLPNKPVNAGHDRSVADRGSRLEMGPDRALASEPRSDSGARAFGVAVTQRLALGGQRELQRSGSSRAVRQRRNPN